LPDSTFQPRTIAQRQYRFGRLVTELRFTSLAINAVDVSAPG